MCEMHEDPEDQSKKGTGWKFPWKKLSPSHDPPELQKCEYLIVPFDKTRLTDYLSYYDRLRSYVQHEDGLINTRLTWSLTIHGFLFAIYGLVLAKIADILAGLYKIPSTSFELQVHTISGLFFFQLPVCVLGIVIGHKSYRAILAAHRALLHLRVIAHQGSLACIPEGERSVANSGAYLPKIVGGGTANEDMVVGAREYYLNIPQWIKYIWILLSCVSLFFGLTMITCQNWYFCS